MNPNPHFQPPQHPHGDDDRLLTIDVSAAAATVPARSRWSSPSSANVTQVDALPVTTVARTIRDCMATGTDPYQLRLAIDGAEAAGTLRRGVARELRAELDAAGVDAAMRDPA